MVMTDKKIAQLVASVAQQFNCFGQGPTHGNPIAHALATRPPSFHLHTDVEAVVRFIVAKCDDSMVLHRRALAWIQSETTCLKEGCRCRENKDLDTVARILRGEWTP